MKKIYLILVFSLGFKLIYGSDLPPLLQEVLARDTSYSELSCNVEIDIQIPGIEIPPKEVKLEMKKGEDIRVDGEGILLLPRRGFIGQYQSLLTPSLQAIKMGNRGDTLIYKLVSLDDSTDWVTADVYVTPNEAQVHRIQLTTRNNGSFTIQHYYPDRNTAFPNKTLLYFEASPIKLPLKFLGQTQTDENLFNADNPIKGMVKLTYSNMECKPGK